METSYSFADIRNEDRTTVHQIVADCGGMLESYVGGLTVASPPDRETADALRVVLPKLLLMIDRPLSDGGKIPVRLVRDPEGTYHESHGPKEFRQTDNRGPYAWQFDRYVVK